MSKSDFLQAWVEITEDLDKRMALAAAYRRVVETFAIELKNLIKYYNERGYHFTLQRNEDDDYIFRILPSNKAIREELVLDCRNQKNFNAETFLEAAMVFCDISIEKAQK